MRVEARINELIARATSCQERKEYAETVVVYTELDALLPRRPEILNNLGVALFGVGRYREAEQRYREALAIDPDLPHTLCNLATLLQADPEESASCVRRALEIDPRFPGARTKLGLLLQSAGRDREAEVAFQEALESFPNDAVAWVGLAHGRRARGRFEEAEHLIREALQLDPNLPAAWAALQSVRRMTAADSEWCEAAEKLAGSGLALWEESELRFALGKYYDDIRNFERAFENFKRGNELLKSVARDYLRVEHAALADETIRTYSRAALAKREPGGCDSARPVFVIGMPRSGTSLLEQIIASHPAAQGAGELDFWLRAARADPGMRRRIPGGQQRKRLAGEYVDFLEHRFPTAARIVDKAPENAHFVGLIHAALPKARIISMRRHPIDVCLSCYFQRFSTALRYTMDLSDLAAYYRTHRRLMAHWREALPSGALLEVPYEELVADQEGWTRKILDFLELEWDPRCLSFHETERTVNTASAWQVRQRLYGHSVDRWRNYQKFIGPLEALADPL
jgi:tetratricopeptide (TPR) repeat protein